MSVSRAQILALAVLAAGPADAQSDAIFDGVWEGTVEVVAVQGVKRPSGVLPSKESPMPFRLEIRGKVATIRSGKRVLRPQGGFAVERFGAAALIYANAASDSWIETWQLSLSKKDADTVLVYVWRVVNNKLLLPDVDGSKHAWGGVGELRRRQPQAATRDVATE